MKKTPKNISDRKRFQMKSPYKSEDEINALITELNLQNKKAEVLQKTQGL